MKKLTLCPMVDTNVGKKFVKDLESLVRALRVMEANASPCCIPHSVCTRYRFTDG